MGKLLGRLLAGVLALAPGVAAAQLLTLGVGGQPAAGAAYTGPGDVVSAAKVWIGLRAYSAAQADGAHKAIALVRASDSHSCDVFLNTSGNLGVTTACSTGGENGTAVATWCNATTCSIDVFYDQTGNGFTFTAHTSSNRAVLSFSCLGALACADFTSATAYYESVISATADGLTTSFVAIRTGNFTAENDILAIGTAVFYDAVANKVGAYFGNAATATASDSAWHAIQIVGNNTSGAIAVDATQTTSLNMGTSGQLANPFLGSGNSSGSNPLTGKLMEVGMWPVAFTGTQMTNVCHNQFIYYGTPTSC
ncbi:hypothetical protein [Phenylobacterium sp.]|uniref:hypothetical protein n=1 Tax=Phenylobacterium sp. TaxID=1871053 RepID=UPI0035653CCE